MTGNRKYLEGDFFVWKSVKFGDIKDSSLVSTSSDFHDSYVFIFI